jgi:hypothetical protein
MFFKNPLNLLLFTPHNIPIIIISLFPLSFGKTLKNAVSKRSFKLDIGAE